MTASPDTAAKPGLLLVSRKWPPAVGGMETYSVELAASLDADFDVERFVLPGRLDGTPPGLAAYAGFVARATWHCLRAGKRFPHVVFTDSLLFPAAVAHALVARTSRRLVVVHGLDMVYGKRRGLLPKLYGLYLGLVVRCQGVFDHLVANSRYTASLAREAGFRAVVVVNPSLPESPLTRATEARDIAPLHAGFGRFVLCFGRLVPRKGAIWFAEHVLPRLPADVGLVVAGPATHAGQVAKLKQLPRVRYVGAVDASTLAALVRAADVVVMPNIRTPDAVDVEGFGLVAIETSSLGGRLIASRLDGIQDAVVDGVTGTLVEPGDADAWVEAVSRSLQAIAAEAPGRRTAIAGATRAAYSRTVQADAFQRLLQPTSS